jgi:hypothetical protein
VRILHAFADVGMECMVFAGHGHVTRASIEPQANPWDDEVQQRNLLDDEPDGQFDLGLFHPVCSKWAGPTSISGDREDHENMIPRARELAKEHCDHWVIENVPAAPLEDAITLDGRQFALPIAYRRSFETSFDVSEPAQYGTIDNAQTSTHYHSEHSKEWWATMKGYGPAAAEHTTKKHIVKNCLPVPYLRHLLTAFYEATGRAEGAGRNYDGYHDEMHEKKARANNQQLEDFA